VTNKSQNLWKIAISSNKSHIRLDNSKQESKVLARRSG